ncbi:hypothetical protein EVAR_39221_1 [Eumeta japonica]|uniref:Uncharacterized protein n=1 Tax=Eumeta variegata TaxID=151549 RepID=A0A4C1VMR8_EUMVA|nr:hypothetical protein EVAR_39221_1 [Eumeta japonica]
MECSYSGAITSLLFLVFGGMRHLFQLEAYLCPNQTVWLAESARAAGGAGRGARRVPRPGVFRELSIRARCFSHVQLAVTIFTARVDASAPRRGGGLARLSGREPLHADSNCGKSLYFDIEIDTPGRSQCAGEIYDTGDTSSY